MAGGVTARSVSVADRLTVATRMFERQAACFFFSVKYVIYIIFFLQFNYFIA